MELFVLSIIYILFCQHVKAEKVKHDIFWNPEITEKFSKGSMFGFDVKIGEYMDVICPQYDVDETNIMTFVIYNVTKQVFENCGKINEGAAKLLNCNRPTKSTKLTMKFQKFSPNPRGFIFRPGESYYLMAYNNTFEAETSQPDCNDKMRMEIRVHPKRHHNHVQMTELQTTTTVRSSPKFAFTKPYKLSTTTEKTNINHAGIVKGRDEHPKSSTDVMSSSVLVFVTSLSIFLTHIGIV